MKYEQQLTIPKIQIQYTYADYVNKPINYSNNDGDVAFVFDNVSYEQQENYDYLAECVYNEIKYKNSYSVIKALKCKLPDDVRNGYKENLCNSLKYMVEPITDPIYKQQVVTGSQILNATVDEENGVDYCYLYYQ